MNPGRHRDGRPYDHLLERLYEAARGLAVANYDSLKAYSRRRLATLYSDTTDPPSVEGLFDPEIEPSSTHRSASAPCGPETRSLQARAGPRLGAVRVSGRGFHDARPLDVRFNPESRHRRVQQAAGGERADRRPVVESLSMATAHPEGVDFGMLGIAWTELLSGISQSGSPHPGIGRQRRGAHGAVKPRLGKNLPHLLAEQMLRLGAFDRNVF